MAKIIMNKAGDKATALNDGDVVVGGAGEQTLLVYATGIGSAKNVDINATVEVVAVQAKAADMSLKYNPATGKVEVTVGGEIIAALQPSIDPEGTRVATADGSFHLKTALGADGKIEAQIGSGTDGATFKHLDDNYKPVAADIDASQKSEIGGDSPTPPTPGADQTFILTPGTDISGNNLESTKGSFDTSGNDLFIAKMGSGATLDGTDRIDGGSGTNTMRLTIDTATSVLAPSGNSIKNMQIIDVSGTFGSGGGITLDAATITGLKTVNIDEVVHSGTGAITLNNMVDGSTIGLKGAVTGYNALLATQGNINASFVAGATTANVTLGDLAGTVGVGLKGTGLTTINVTGNTVDASRLGLVNGSLSNTTPAYANTVTTLNISTDKQADVAYFGSGSLATVNGSDSSGNITLHLDDAHLAASGVSIKTGAGNDEVWARMSDIKADTVIDLGAGDKDMFVMTDVPKAADGALDTAAGGVTDDAYTAIGKMTGVETVGFFLGDQATYAIDALKLGGKNIYLDETGDGASTITLSNVAESQIITSAMNLQGASESLIVTSAHQSPTQGVINIVTEGVGDELTIGSASSFGILNLSGVSDVEILTPAHSIVVDGSKMTGKLTITGSEKIDIFTVGSGGSEITGSKGLDDVTFGAGVDVFKHDSNPWATGTDPINMTTIHNLSAGDKLDFTASPIGGGAFTAATAEVKTVTDDMTLLAAITKAQLSAKITWFVWNDDTYIVANDTTTSSTTGDDVVKIAGTTGFDLTHATYAPYVITLA